MFIPFALQGGYHLNWIADIEVDDSDGLGIHFTLKFQGDFCLRVQASSSMCYLIVIMHVNVLCPFLSTAGVRERWVAAILSQLPDSNSIANAGVTDKSKR